MRRRRTRAIPGLALSAALVVALPVAASAAFLISGNSTTTARAASFPAPAKPAVADVAAGVKVTWTATALDSGRAVDSYTVRRTVGTTLTTVCTTTSLTCTDTSPSKTATASYVVVAKLGNWSSPSAAATYVPDTTPPTIAKLRLSADTGAWDSDFITEQAAQTFSGVTEAGAAVSVAYDGSTQAVVAADGGAFSVPLMLVVGTFDIKVTATDAAGNSASVTQAVTLNKGGTTVTEPVTTGNSDTVMDDIEWSIPSSSTSTFCVTTTITGATAKPAAWQLLVHLDTPPFRGAAAKQIYYRGDSQVSINAVAGSTTLAKVTGVGNNSGTWNSNYNNALLDSATTLTITLCDSSPQAPPVGDSSWYTATTAKGPQGASQACVVLTVTPTVSADSNPFFFGWRATVDLKAAKAFLTAQGRTVNYVSWSPDPSSGYQFTTSPDAASPVVDSYALTSGIATAVKAGSPQTITACVIGF